jgi:hypothetical protein
MGELVDGFQGVAPIVAPWSGKGDHGHAGRGDPVSAEVILYRADDGKALVQHRAMGGECLALPG